MIFDRQLQNSFPCPLLASCRNACIWAAAIRINHCCLFCCYSVFLGLLQLSDGMYSRRNWYIREANVLLVYPSMRDAVQQPYPPTSFPLRALKTYGICSTSG